MGWGTLGWGGTGTRSLAQPGTLCLPQITSDIFEQTFGPPNGIRDDRYGGPAVAEARRPLLCATNLPFSTGMRRLRT